MEIVAKTKGGVLISATEIEVGEILNAVTGTMPKELSIGQKIPAIDYASTITKIKCLKSNYNYRQILERSKDFLRELDQLKDAVNSASNIEM